MWQWVKACKGVALIAFFLPWMTVSCSGAELIRASGWDLATGHPRLAPALAQMAQGSGAAAAQRGEAHASVWLILALLAIVAGLVAAFRPSGVGAKPVIGAALAAAAVLAWMALTGRSFATRQAPPPA